MVPSSFPNSAPPSSRTSAESDFAGNVTHPSWRGAPPTSHRHPSAVPSALSASSPETARRVRSPVSTRLSA